jgi:Spy/CpxP family protein refolding chaperone
MKKLAAIVAAVSIVALAALAYGDMGGHGMGSGMMCGCGMDGQMMGTEHLKSLSLDEQQKTLIGEIKSRMMKEMIEAGPMMEGMGMKHDRECSKTEQ